MFPRSILTLTLWQIVAVLALAQPPAKAPAAGSARQRAQQLAERATEMGLPVVFKVDDRLTLTRPARNPEEALKLFTEAIAADPSYLEGYLGRSRMREMLRDLVGAREDLQQAATISADSLELQSRLVALAYDFEDAEAVRRHSAAWFKLATAEREEAGTTNDRNDDLVRFALRAELWDEAIALCDRFIAPIKDPQQQIPLPYLRGLALLARGKATLAPGDVAPRQDRMTSERIDFAAKNPQTSAADLLAMARSRVSASRLPFEISPAAAQIEIYDRAIQKNPQEAAAYYERAKLKWAEHKSLSERAAGFGMTGRSSAESRLTGPFAKTKIFEDCEQAAKLGLKSKELTDLLAEIKAYVPPKPTPPSGKKAEPDTPAAAELARRQWFESLLNAANREMTMLRGAFAGESFQNYVGYKYGSNRVRILAEELLRLDPAKPDGWKLRGAYRIAFGEDPAGSKEDLQKAAQLAPDRLDVQLELALRSARLADEAETRRIAGDAYAERLAALAGANQAGVQDALLVEFAFLAERWNDVLKLVPKPADKSSSFVQRRMRILSLLALGEETQAAEEKNLLNNANLGSVGDQVQFIYRAKNARYTSAQLLTLIENFRKYVPGNADLIAMYDRVIEVDARQGSALVERAALRWEIRKSLLVADARTTEKNALRNHYLNQVYTAARISADLDAAGKLGVADPRIATLRGSLQSESLLTSFERDPTKINADAKQLLAFARQESQSKRPFAERIQLYDLAIKAGPRVAEAYLERAELRFKSVLDVSARFRADVEYSRRSGGKQDVKLLEEFRALDGKPIMADIDTAVSLGMSGDAVVRLEDQVRQQFNLGGPAGWADRLPDVSREAEKLLAEKGFDEALRPWDALAQRYPKVWEVQVERLKFVGGKPPSAPPQQFASTLDTTLGLYPAAEKDQIDKYLSLISWYLEHDAKAQAAVVCERCALVFPATGEARERLGWAAFDSGQYQVARSSLAAALAGLEGTGANPAAEATGSSAASPARKPWSAARLKRQIEVLGRLEGEPRTAAAWAERANLWSLLGENRQAFADYARVIELAPKSVLARCWRAARHIAARDFAAAQADIDAALKLNSRSSEAYAGLGALRQAQGNSDEALKAFGTALECSPRRVEANLGRARIFYSRGDLHKVFEELAAASLVPPPDRPLLLPPMPLTPPPAQAVAAATPRSAVDATKSSQTPMPVPRGAKGPAKPQAKPQPPGRPTPKPAEAVDPAAIEAALREAISWLTRDTDQDLFLFREFANSKTTFSPKESGSIAQGLAALPADSPFRVIYDGATWQSTVSAFRHEMPVLTGSQQNRAVNSEYRDAWRSARRRVIRAETLADRYAIALKVDDVDSLDLLDGVDKAPAAYADPLLPTGVAEQVRRDAVALLNSRLSAFEARTGSDAANYELSETRRRTEQLAAVEKPDAALREWLQLSSRFLAESAVMDAVRTEYNKIALSPGADQELLGRLAFNAGYFPAAHRHLSAALEQQDLAAPLALRRQVQVLSRLLDRSLDRVPYIQRANVLALAGENQPAINHYSQILQHYAGSVRVRCWRAGRHMAKGDFAAAKTDIDAALALHAQSPLAHLCLGAWHQAQFDLDSALAAFGKTIELDPRQTLAYNRRAAIFAFRGDFKAAAAEIRCGLSQESDDAPSLLPGRLPPREVLASDPKPAAALLPQGRLKLPVAQVWADLARGAADSAIDRLAAIGLTSDDCVWFARGIAEAVRDEDQLLFAAPVAFAEPMMGVAAGPVAARLALENTSLPGASDMFLALYDPVEKSGARLVDVVSSWAHHPVRYALPDETRITLRREFSAAGSPGPSTLESLLSLERQVPRRNQFDAERLSLLRQAVDAPTRLFDDPLDPPGLTQRTRLTALVKLNSLVSREWQSAKPANRDKLGDELNQLENRMETLETELAPIFARGAALDTQVTALTDMVLAGLTPESQLSNAESLIKADRENPIGYCLRAAAKMRLGKWTEAKADIDLVVRVRPATPEVYIIRGAWKQAHYHLQEALDDFAKASSLNPRLREPYFRQSLIHYFQGKLNAAFDDGIQALTSEDIRIPQPLAIPIEFPAPGPVPAEIRPARVLLEAMPAEQRQTFEAVLLKLVSGDVVATRGLLKTVPVKGNEAMRAVGLLDAFEYLRDPKRSQISLRRNWVEVFGMHPADVFGAIVSPQEKQWAARRDQLSRLIYRERQRRELEQGERPWKSPSGRVSYYASRAATLVEFDKPSEAAAKLELIAAPAAELRQSKEGLPAKYPTEVNTAIRLFDAAQAELALKTDDRPAAMQAIDRVLQRPAGSQSRDEAAYWPLRQVDLAWKMGDPYTAIDCFTPLIDQFGNGSRVESLVRSRLADVQASWYASRGTLWLALGRTEDAYLDFALVTLAADNPQTYIDEARRKFAGPLKTNPVDQHVTRLVAEARSDISDGLPDLGIPYLEAALKLKPDDMAVKTLLADALVERSTRRGFVERRIFESIADARAALALLPRDPRYQKQLEDMLINGNAEYAYTRWKEGETPAELQSRLRTAISFRPTWPDQRFDLVLALYDGKEYFEALAESDRAAACFEAKLKDEAERNDWDRLKGQYAKLLRTRALTLYAQVPGVDRLGAEIDLTRALELQPNDAATETNRGKLLFLIGRVDEAQQCFDRALAIDGKLVDAIDEFKKKAEGSFVKNSKEIHDRRYLITGKQRYFAEEYEAALSDLARAAESFPDDLELQTFRAGALLKLGRTAQGMAELQKVLAKKPSATALTLSAEQLQAAGRYAEAEQAITEAISMGARGPRVLGLRAVARTKQSKFDLAKSDFISAHQGGVDGENARFLARCIDETDEFELAEVDAGRQPASRLFDSNRKNLGDVLRHLARRSDDPVKRAALLTRAAETERHPLTCFEFGIEALGAAGQKRDLLSAARWFARAAALGHSDAGPYVKWLEAYAAIAPDGSNVAKAVASAQAEVTQRAQPADRDKKAN